MRWLTASTCCFHAAFAFFGAGITSNKARALSQDAAAYLAEFRSLAAAPGPTDYALMLCDKLLWYAPPLVKKWLNPHAFHLYDHRAKRWD